MIRKIKMVTYSFKSISRFRKIAGVFLGLSYAAILYAFQFTFRESLRVASTSEFNEMWLLSDEEVSFYNWFAAALSLLIGQSICLGYWFSRPKRFAERGIRSRSTIINDQRVMQVSFLMWFLKLGFLYAIFFGLTWQNGHYGMSVYPDFAIMFILVILMLFFISWNTIRLKFKIKSYKWMLITFFTLGLASWGMSKINVVDYEGANERILAENVWMTHDLQLPEVSIYESGAGFNEDMLPYFFVLEDSTGDEVRMKIDDRFAPCCSKGTYIGDLNLGCHMPFETKLRTEFRLYIDKRIKMGIVKEILSNCYDNEVFQVTFAVLPDNAKYPAAAYNGTVIHSYVPWEYENQNDYLAIQERLDSIPNQIVIEHDIVGECKVNGRITTYNNLETELFELFIVNTDFLVEYIYSDELPFNDYIQFRVAANVAIYRVRDFFSWDERGEAYDLTYHGYDSYYDKKYPLRISTISNAFLQSQE